VLPYQDVWTLIQWYLKIDKFILAEDQMADFSFEVSLRFPTVVIQVILINITYQDAVDDSRIFSFGVIV
jgi:energy-converting hydrogenase Eha subunit A